MVCWDWLGSPCHSQNCHLHARNLLRISKGRWCEHFREHWYLPPPMLPMSLSCVPSSRSSSSPLGEPDITSSSESILGGEGDGRSETGVPGACRSVLVLRDLTGWMGSSSAISEAFRLLTWEFVVTRGVQLRLSETAGCRAMDGVVSRWWWITNGKC